MAIKDLAWERPSLNYWVFGILLASILLRWVLISQGGQYYFSDEQRYQTSREMTELLMHGKVKDAGLMLFSTPEHLGYKLIGIVPALVERIVGPSLLLPAMFFSLFSVLNLYLIFLLSKRLSASPYEALLALLFASISQSLFYFSRHLLPYDVAMTFGLLAFYISLTGRPATRTSIACGVLSFLCFITYNGYWALAGLAMLVHVFNNGEAVTGIFRRGVLLGIGFLLPLSILLAYSARFDINFVQQYQRFAGTVTQGNYEEGWSLPFAYLWHAEYFLFVLLGLLALYAILMGKGHKGVFLWGSSILFIYLCLVVPSFFLHSFVVYGRLVRQITPFLILLAVCGFGSLSRNRQPATQRMTQVVLLVILVQAIWNFNSTVRVAFPRDFVRKVQGQYPDFSFSPKRFSFGAPEVCADHGYAMQNAKYFLVAPGASAVIPGRILSSASHPVNFLPYQYEGYTPEQRQAFRQSKLRMVFYELQPEFAVKEDLKKIGILSCLTRE